MRISRRSNIRVEVYPNATSTYFYTLLGKSKEEIDRLDEREAKRIASEITRHVDDIKDVQVLWDTSQECSFCGYAFAISEKSTDEPACCDDALAEFHLALAKVLP